ncbi:squalene/phytoene synthase family protein [Paracoccus sp. TOH]|uniref:Squalene/phytoene synthase family protein n=1 Tax=Paracoccus simplex TaxID=2086346 RepID=A0ABV7RVJ5_9RHOB|nr:squalene/phytoene synthase family protein [Paracoccus sp. TOH]WJS85653.1 squalene/phytoene synthase family protein [Paracoccus sp. TOH]
MSLQDCAEALRAHDPDRFGICLLAPAGARPKLMTLYALNLELARAPLASAEPLIAEMRLQWWIERLEDIGAGKPQAHELLTPLAEAWGPRAAAFAVLAEARRRDAAREPLDGPDAVAAYVRDTAVPLTVFAAEALAGTAGGFAPPDPRGVFSKRRNTGAARVIAAQAEGVGLAHWLAALPALQGLGLGLWDPSAEALGRIADQAGARLAEAKAQRRHMPRRLAPALFPGAGIRAVLQAAPRGIEALAGVAPSEFRRRLALGGFALTQRWWR